MGYEFNTLCFTDEQINEYKNTVINKIFAVLGIYEDCIREENLDGYYKYLNRICTELNGIYHMFGVNSYL